MIYVGISLHKEIRRKSFVFLSLRRAGKGNDCDRNQNETDIPYT